MIGQIRKLQVHSRMLVGLVALVSILVILILAVSSFTGVKSGGFSYKQASLQDLPEGIHIAGWSSLDRDSLHIGESVQYRIRVLYQPEHVTPDLDTFESVVEILPLEKRVINETRRKLDNSISEYVLEYTLQAVGVDLNTSYQLKPALMYYRINEQPELLSFEIPAPRIHIVSFYPDDIANVELKELKGEFRDPSIVTRTIAGLAGILLAALGLAILWRHGKKRRISELSLREKLWLEYEQLGKNSSGNSKDMLQSQERIFTQLLASQTAITPNMFWAGINPQQGYWKEAAVTARNLFREIYRSVPPAASNIRAATTLLQETFASVVETEKIKAALEPTFAGRLAKQPEILAVSGITMIIAVLMLVLATRVSVWLPEYMIQYNALVSDVQQSGGSEDQALEFSEIAKTAAQDVIKAAALYNAGTLTASSMALLTPEQMQVLNDIFRNVEPDEISDVDNEGLLQSLILGIETYRRAELQLKDSTRVADNDEVINRNLEIVIKRRQAAVDALKKIVQTGHVEESMMDELLDLINSQMALEFKFEEGDEAPGYYIGEFF